MYKRKRIQKIKFLKKTKEKIAKDKFQETKELNIRQAAGGNIFKLPAVIGISTI